LGEDSRGPTWKGRLLEDLVEYYFKLRGFHGVRNARIRGSSGAVHEVDLLLRSSGGVIVVEVKNVATPVPKEAVIKAFEVARDIGARGAIVVSASGFTRDAERMARSLGVELISMEEILDYIESARALEGSVLLRPRHSVGEADSTARRRASRILFFRREEPLRLGCIYAPFYYVEATIRVEGPLPRYRDVDIVVSGVSGLPLYRRGPRILEGAPRASGLPPELSEAYRLLAGRSVTWGEASSIAGESAWRRLYHTLKGLGLLEVVSSKPKRYRVVDDRPPLNAVEEAAGLFLAPKTGGPGDCGAVEPRYSPGSAASLVERLYAATSRRVTTLHAPLAAYKLVRRDGSYRYLLLTLWTPRIMELNPVDPVSYVEALL